MGASRQCRCAAFRTPGWLALHQQLQHRTGCPARGRDRVSGPRLRPACCRGRPLSGSPSGRRPRRQELMTIRPVSIVGSFTIVAAHCPRVKPCPCSAAGKPTSPCPRRVGTRSAAPPPDPGPSGLRSMVDHRDYLLSCIEELPPFPQQILDVLGLRICEDVTAGINLPRFDNSAMDGYAVRAADVVKASPDTPSVCRWSARWPRARRPGIRCRLAQRSRS